MLDRYGVAAMVGAHVQPRVETGRVSTGVAPSTRRSTPSRSRSEASGATGATHISHWTRSGYWRASSQGLNELGARAIDPTHPSVISVGQIEGGTAPNVIASSATCRGTIRTTSTADRDILITAITRMAEGMASARGTTARVRIIPGGPALINSARLVHAVDPLLEQAGLTLVDQSFRSCGSDDFAVYGRDLPILMMFVGAGEHSLHSCHYLPDDDALRRTARALAAGYVGVASTI